MMTSLARQPLRLALALLLASSSALCLAAPESPVPDAIAEGSTLLLFKPSVSFSQAEAADAEAFGKALGQAFLQALERQGFRPLEGSPEAPGGGPSELAVAARAAGAAWAAAASLRMEGSRLSYRLAVYDAIEGALVSAESFSTYAGLGALPIMGESARAAAERASAHRGGIGGGEGETVIRYRITLSSRDEGAIVSADTAGSAPRELGRIEGGRCVLPYLPLRVGSPIALTLSAPGMRPARVEGRAGDEELVLNAPPLVKIERHAIYLDTGPGRLLGLGLGYRYFVKPDWAFAFVEARAFAGYDFSAGADPVFHTELWQGLGSYLVVPPSCPVRAGLCVGIGELFSSSTAAAEEDRVFADIAIMPIGAFVECGIGRSSSIWASARAAFSLGLDSGLLARGWVGGNPPILVSCGWKWKL